MTGGAATLPEGLLAPPTRPYRRLNPATKLVIGLSGAAFAFFAGTWTGPLVVLAVVLASAALAGVLRALATVALLALTVIGAILLVNTFFLPGATDEIVRIGPLAPTWSGLADPTSWTRSSSPSPSAWRRGWTGTSRCGPDTRRPRC